MYLSHTKLQDTVECVCVVAEPNRFNASVLAAMDSRTWNPFWWKERMYTLSGGLPHIFTVQLLVSGDHSSEPHHLWWGWGGGGQQHLKSWRIRPLSFSDWMTPLWLLVLCLRSITSHCPWSHLKDVAVAARCSIFLLERRWLENSVWKKQWEFEFSKFLYGGRPGVCGGSRPPSWQLQARGWHSSRSPGSCLSSSLLPLLSFTCKRIAGDFLKNSRVYVDTRKGVFGHQQKSRILNGVHTRTIWGHKLVFWQMKEKEIWRVTSYVSVC